MLYFEKFIGQSRKAGNRKDVHYEFINPVERYSL